MNAHSINGPTAADDFGTPWLPEENAAGQDSKSAPPAGEEQPLAPAAPQSATGQASRFEQSERGQKVSGPDPVAPSEPCACRFDVRSVPDFSGQPPLLLEECGFHAARNQKQAEAMALVLSQLTTARAALLCTYDEKQYAHLINESDWEAEIDAARAAFRGAK